MAASVTRTGDEAGGAVVSHFLAVKAPRLVAANHVHASMGEAV